MGGTSVNFKAKRKALADVEDEIAASEAQTEALKIQRDNLNKDLMQECDFIAADVVGDRNSGPDSAFYAGFGYNSQIGEKTRRRKTKTPPSS